MNLLFHTPYAMAKEHKLLRSCTLVPNHLLMFKQITRKITYLEENYGFEVGFE
jgi:hypothetical protein